MTGRKKYVSRVKLSRWLQTVKMKWVRRKWIFIVLVCSPPLLYLLYNLDTSCTGFGPNVKDNNVRCRTSQHDSVPLLAQLPTTTKQVAIKTSSKRILLVSYARSGSTFVSYILKEVPGAFFFFEPLRPHVIRSTIRQDLIMSYRAIGTNFTPPRELNLSKLSQYEQKAVAILENVFECQMGKLTMDDYLSNLLRGHAHTEQVAKCLRPIVNDTYLNLPRYLQCLVDFLKLCQSKHIRLIKTIRLPLRAVFDLMRKYADLHLIYLVRDPRATLFSQQKNFGYAQLPEDFCPMVEDDVAHALLIQKQFPGRFMAVRYEDISESPLDWTKRLYSGLGLTLTDRVLSFVRRLTSFVKDSDEYNIYRKSSKKTSNSWREKIEQERVLRTDLSCINVYRLLGYRPVRDEFLLRNLNISLTEPVHVFRTL